MKMARKEMGKMWDRGEDWEVLGATITFLNVESRFVPGEDASYVREQTDRLIKEAHDAF